MIYVIFYSGVDHFDGFLAVLKTAHHSPEVKLKTNIHPMERVLRITIGLAISSLAFIGPENRWFLFGLVPLATGLSGWCPPYQLLGINTCKLKLWR